eukprot:30477_1
MSTTRNKYRSLPHFEHNIDLNNQICIIEQCKLYQQLFRLLNEYNSDEYFEDSDSDKMCNILNAFHHVLQFHDSDQQFKQIYDELNKQCKYQSCKIYNRHNIRRRHHHIEDEYKSNQSTYAYTTQHILDKLHSFYLHSYDTCMRTRYTDMDVIQQKGLLKRDSDHDQFMYSNNKFNSKLHISNNDKKENIYSFGERFEYEDEKQQLFVKQKYATLKEEVLTNNMSIDIYNAEMKKCTLYSNTKHIKTLKKRNLEHNICTSHILSLLIYCNCDTYQNKWSETYRRIPLREDTLSLKNR